MICRYCSSPPGKDEDKIEGFRAGGDDYFTKPFNIDELILRVKAIIRRNQPVRQEAAAEPRTLQVGGLILDCRTFEVTTSDRQVLLTPIQFDLLYHLMSHAGEVFSAERLLREVWDYPYDTGSPDLVRVHVRNIRERIELDSSEPEYLRTVPGHGYAIFPGMIPRHRTDRLTTSTFSLRFGSWLLKTI